MNKRLLTSCIFILSYISSYSQCDSLKLAKNECTCFSSLINAFTPNNDGLNDYFGFKSNCELSKNFNLEIYNRFGEVIFETNDVNQKWDGFYKGKLCSSGVYAYIIDYQFKYIRGNKIIKQPLTLGF